MAKNVVKNFLKRGFELKADSVNSLHFFIAQFIITGSIILLFDSLYYDISVVELFFSLIFMMLGFNIISRSIAKKCDCISGNIYVYICGLIALMLYVIFSRHPGLTFGYFIIVFIIGLSAVFYLFSYVFFMYEKYKYAQILGMTATCFLMLTNAIYIIFNLNDFYTIYYVIAIIILNTALIFFIKLFYVGFADTTKVELG